MTLHSLGQWAQRAWGLLLLVLVLMAFAVVAVTGVGPPLFLSLTSTMFAATAAVVTLKVLCDKHLKIGDGPQKWRSPIVGVIYLRPRLRHQAWPLLG